MAYHIPFSHRPSGRQNRPVYYIGFERPRRPRKKRNWWGINSIVLFFLTFGILSPVTLLMALKGLGRKPRGSALVGTGLSLFGTAVISVVMLTVIGHAREAKVRQIQRYHAMQNAPLVEQTQDLLLFAADEFEGYREDNDGRLPEHHDGNMLSIKHVDPWGNELMYEVEGEYAGLRSAGPDSRFFTSDDVTHNIEGETGAETLLPVDEAEQGLAEEDLD